MPTLKSLQLALIAAIVGLAVTVHASADMYKGYEMPPFEVEARDGAFEVRRYAPHVVAEVAIEGNRGAAIRQGFRTLADYIFGGNAAEEKVAMTVPVTQAGGNGQWTVRFMMPAAYTLDTLPEPRNDAIRFVQTEPERHLVVKFSGRGTSANLDEQARALMEYARANGLRPGGAPRFHFYDDPFTLPWNRRNEVSLPLS